MNAYLIAMELSIDRAWHVAQTQYGQHEYHLNFQNMWTIDVALNKMLNVTITEKVWDDRFTYRQTPVHAKMNWHDHMSVWEDVHSSRPSLDRCMASIHQFGVEECVESINLGEVIHLSSLHQDIHIKVDDLGIDKQYNLI